MDKIVHDDKGNAFTLSTCLGEGGQGVVFRVKRNTGHGLAAKVILDPVSGDILQDHSAYKKYMRKLNQIMALPQVAHIAVPLAPLHAPYCGYVMRLMECMEPLSEYLRSSSDIKATLCRKGGLSKRYEILKNLSAILCELHSLGIVYGDLAPGNIYISTNDKDCEVWLIDLDNLAYATEVSSSIGTPLYRAPEIVKGKANSLETDCYSFALLAYELLTFSKPFNGSIMDEDPVDDFLFIKKDEIKQSKISKEIEKQFYEGHCIASGGRKSAADVYVMRLAFMYDVNYVPALEYIQKQNYLRRMIDRIGFENPDTMHTFDAMLQTIEKNMKKRMETNE